MVARFDRLFLSFGLLTLAACGSKSGPAETQTAAPTPAPSSVATVTGVLDEPKDGAAVPARFVVGGWAFGKGGALQEIQVLVDGRQTGVPSWHGARPDVAKAFANDPEAANSGFMTMIDTASLNAGKHEVEARAKLGDGSVRSFGKATVTVSK